MDLVKGDFGLSLTIPAYKKVYYKSERTGTFYQRAYNSIKTSDQKKFLEHILIDIASSLNIDNIKWVFEPHKDCRLHIHLIIYNTHDIECQRFIEQFYNNNFIKIKKFTSLFDCRLLNNVEQWLNYMFKEIHIWSSFDSETTHIKNLDNGVKIETNKYKPHQDILKPLISQLESPILGDEYNFGKLKNKYIVNL